MNFPLRTTPLPCADVSSSKGIRKKRPLNHYVLVESMSGDNYENSGYFPKGDKVRVIWRRFKPFITEGEFPVLHNQFYTQSVEIYFPPPALLPDS